MREKFLFWLILLKIYSHYSNLKILTAEVDLFGWKTRGEIHEAMISAPAVLHRIEASAQMSAVSRHLLEVDVLMSLWILLSHPIEWIDIFWLLFNFYISTQYGLSLKYSLRFLHSRMLLKKFSHWWLEFKNCFIMNKNIILFKTNKRKQTLT